MVTVTYFSPVLAYLDPKTMFNKSNLQPVSKLYLGFKTAEEKPQRLFCKHQNFKTGLKTAGKKNILKYNYNF